MERQTRINAEKREKYWREKFAEECLEMTEDSNADLTVMFQSANSIPEHMAGLWEQQKLLLSSKSKNAYRWHPKLVLCFDAYELKFYSTGISRGPFISSLWQGDG